MTEWHTLDTQHSIHQIDSNLESGLTAVEAARWLEESELIEEITLIVLQNSHLESGGCVFFLLDGLRQGCCGLTLKSVATGVSLICSVIRRLEETFGRGTATPPQVDDKLSLHFYSSISLVHHGSILLIYPNLLTQSTTATPLWRGI